MNGGGSSERINAGYFHPTTFDSQYAYSKISMGELNAGSYEEVYPINLLGYTFVPGIDVDGVPVRLSYQNSYWKVTALEACRMGSSVSDLKTFSKGQSMQLHYSETTSYIYFAEL